MSDSGTSAALTELLEEAAREVSFRGPAMGGLAARLREAGAAIARQSLPPGLGVLMDVRDELQLIGSVLRGYPVSIARNDAQRAVWKLLRTFKEKEMPAETKDPLAFDAELVRRALQVSGGVRSAVFEALERLRVAAVATAPAPAHGIEPAAKKLAECMDYPWALPGLKRYFNAGDCGMAERANGGWVKYADVQAALAQATPTAQAEPMSEAKIDEIFDRHKGAPTMSFRYYVARDLEAHHGITQEGN